MDELVMNISQKLAISPDVARKAVHMTADYLESKLPQPLAIDVEGFLDQSDISEEETRLIGQFQFP